MENTFANLIEEIKKLSPEEKEELLDLLHKLLVDARRDEIHDNYQDSLKEVKEGKLKYSSKVSDLNKELD
jgi:hypothetical protein